MTAQSTRYDAQRALDRPLTTLADAGRQITDEREALLHLLMVAERNVERGLGDGQLRIAVERVRAVQR